MQTKAFSFCYETYTVNALAYLYLDGKIKDVEITAIWYKGQDILRTLHEEEQPPYIQTWLKQKIKDLRHYGIVRLQQMQLNAALYFEYEFL
jgi:hypothetical protein